MKRSEIINIIVNTLLCASDGFVKPGVLGFSCPRQGEDKLRLAAEEVLKELEESGMLPPTQAPSLVEDTRNGGLKHGPAQRVWDEE